MIALSLALSFLGCLGFAAFWSSGLRAREPVLTEDRLQILKAFEAVVAEAHAATAKATELEQRLDARELKDAMKGGGK